MVHHLLFHNLTCFSIKVATVRHPVIQKKVDELLTKAAVEPSTGDAGFYLNVFVVSKYTGGL